MDPRSILLGQIEALIQELNEADETLKVASEIDRDLYERVRVPFATEIQRQRRALQDLWERAEGVQVVSGNLWQAFRRVRDECRQVFRESLALLEGALARREGLDRGLCRTADALLDDLSHASDIPWGRFTILAEGEFLGEMAQIIRLRYPELSLWSLPIAAHEFGHFAGPRLRVREGGKIRTPFQALLENEWQKGMRAGGKSEAEKRWSYLHERFADLYAVYTTGPAFICTCLLLRFDPVSAHTGWNRHPSDAERAYWLLAALGKMDELESKRNPPFAPFRQALQDIWKDNLAAVGQSQQLPSDRIQELDNSLDRLWALLAGAAPEVRYRGEGWGRALALAEALDPDRRRLPPIAPDMRLADVVNAAWVARIDYADNDSYRLRRIGDTAFDLCRQLAPSEPALETGR